MNSKVANIVRQIGKINRENREKLLGQRGLVIWFTGLPSSGKSTLAYNVENILYENGYLTQVFDGDNIRHGLCNDLSFSLQDREENLRRIAEVCKLAIQSGIISLTAFITPIEEHRTTVRKLIGNNDLVEIYCKCSLDICEARDTKGNYQKARDGLISGFTGITSPYEEPKNVDLVIDTEKISQENCAKKVVNFLLDNYLN